jgi:hypothetical protein
MGPTLARDHQAVNDFGHDWIEGLPLQPFCSNRFVTPLFNRLYAVVVIRLSHNGSWQSIDLCGIMTICLRGNG